MDKTEATMIPVQKQYEITGMTCGGCVRRVKTALEEVPGVIEAEVQLAVPQGVLTLDKQVSPDQLRGALGHYEIRELPTAPPAEPMFQLPQATVPPPSATTEDLPEISATTYRPLLMIVGFLVGVTVLAQFPFAGGFDGTLWMRHFMAGFFLTFAFFKLLNIRGFASSYAMYDLVAARWRGWGFVYPFVELGLGILYLINLFPTLTNWLTVIILGVSSIGVIRSVLNRQKIKCACLGDVFNLPMSTVTIVEDLTMVAMAGAMLLL